MSNKTTPSPLAGEGWGEGVVRFRTPLPLTPSRKGSGESVS